MSSEKALNELKKATMASYLAKAPRAQRADDKIARDFDNDYGKDLATANKHHPNMITPGFEKSPEKLAKAEKSMKVNADLRDTFKRKANSRIKGIARAGRLLAKEETLDEAPLSPEHKAAINELKTSTLASVAVKRYAQAQAALKDKDYGGYVKNKQKSMKAADATIPKSGWSPEDDKKNEEIVPVISATEKYRQIKEAKLRARKGK